MGYHNPGFAAPTKVLHVPEAAIALDGGLIQFATLVNLIESQSTGIQINSYERKMVLQCRPEQQSSLTFGLNYWKQNIPYEYNLPCLNDKPTSAKNRLATMIIQSESLNQNIQWILTACYPTNDPMITQDGWIGFTFQYAERADVRTQPWML
jgi:hypothetical protein